MKKQTLDLQTLTMISLFAALIFLSIQFFKIPVSYTHLTLPTKRIV